MWEEAQVINSDRVEIQEERNQYLPVIRCRVDGSWKSSYPTFGLGWFCKQGENIVLLGARDLRKSLSPLHSNIEALLWAIRQTVRNRLVLSKP